MKPLDCGIYFESNVQNLYKDKNKNDMLIKFHMEEDLKLTFRLKDIDKYLVIFKPSIEFGLELIEILQN